ncbi:MAG: TlpA family protein disulfide reductase [Allosphingosinicella sp.]|uniref:TlpA family protein disulfide reductase n=1 Tax=Allosphingosinicella sp. TaxID=2823234 RepID=UPI0039540D97
MRLVIACLLASLALAGCDRQKAGEPQAGAPGAATPAPQGKGLDRSRAGTAAPDATFQDPDGAPASLADFRGKPVLVNLWATWCAPCVVEMPELDALARREGERLQVLTLSQDLEGREKVSEFFAARDFKAIEPYLDQDMAFMTSLGVSILPTTILYDSQGREVWRMTGIEEWTGDTARALIAEAR